MPLGNIPPNEVENMAEVYVSKGLRVDLRISRVDDALDIYVNGKFLESFDITHSSGSVALQPHLAPGTNEIWLDSTDYGPGGQNHWSCVVDLDIEGQYAPTNGIGFDHMRYDANNAHYTKRFQYKIIVS